MLQALLSVRALKIALGALALYLLICFVMGFVWTFQPAVADVRALAAAHAREHGREPVVGYTTTWALFHLGDTLLEKPGGYLTNNILPPRWWIDNMPNWEFGVLVQVRDMARVMRNDLSRSQSQSTEDPDLSEAEGKFFFDNNSWWFPATEHEYRSGLELLERYLGRLADPSRPDAQFYARADNLVVWLDAVTTRLGSLSQRLSASVGKRQLNVDLAGDSTAEQATEAPDEMEVRTPWTEIDDVFFEARGQAFALIHLLHAIEVDFREVLRDKNALVSVQQIVRELEPTQDFIWAPMILNGSGLGFTANHSLVMASYVARANAALIDLRRLLRDG